MFPGNDCGSNAFLLETEMIVQCRECKTTWIVNNQGGTYPALGSCILKEDGLCPECTVKRNGFIEEFYPGYEPDDSVIRWYGGAM